jgi:ribose transport system ATP-binding protein
MHGPLLEARNLTKSFPGVRALRGVSLSLSPGEVVAVAGENGAGKSTLMKILAGVIRPDSGTLLIDGQPARLGSVGDALALGVVLIHQELNLAGNLDVAANIFLGREPRRFGLLDPARLNRDSRVWLDAVGLAVDPSVRVDSLSPGQRQLVEIAKALAANARVLIMDEPTSSLSEGEAGRLFDVIQDLRARGVGILYISHRLGEIARLADRAVVLRDGEVAGHLDRGGLDPSAIVRLMVGRDIGRFHHRATATAGPPVLQVHRLRTAAHPDHRLDFTVHSGEIVGIAGLVGSGRTSLLQCLFGIRGAAGGQVRVDGRPINPSSPRDAIAAGIALAPEDRQHHGLALDLAVDDNLTLASLHHHHRFGLLNRRFTDDHCRSLIQSHRIRTPHARQPTRLLSGGNQQKIVLAKWLACRPRLLLLDEPTRGIDVGAKQEIYRLIGSLTAEGMAILFVSSELEEIIGLSDRVLVMHEGRLAGTLDRAALHEETIMQLATGVQLTAA